MKMVEINDKLIGCLHCELVDSLLIFRRKNGSVYLKCQRCGNKTELKISKPIILIRKPKEQPQGK